MVLVVSMVTLSMVTFRYTALGAVGLGAMASMMLSFRR